jgi:activator of 2-hydroxyglutaryl-CoA dehydratase
MKIIGMDVGSTTVKAVAVEDGEIVWRDYQRHGTKQAEKVLDFLSRIEAECGLELESDLIFFTGSGAGLIAPLVGGKVIQEVVAVAASVEKMHPDVHFVSEIGGEDMKTIFLTESGAGKAKQVYMQSACSGGTGTFVEKTARKLQITPEDLAKMPYDGQSLHKVSSKCGIFAEADSNSLLKGGVPVGEIIASLFEAVVYQNLASLTKGNTPQPQVLLLGGPNLFFEGLRQAWRRHLNNLWTERQLVLPQGASLEDLIIVPDEALYYAALGCVEIGKGEAEGIGAYKGPDRLAWWIEEGQHEAKAKEGGKSLARNSADLIDFRSHYDTALVIEPKGRDATAPVFVGCDFGSTTAKVVVLSGEKELLFTAYAPSKGNPIEDAKAVFRQMDEAGYRNVAGLALTGYGKDLLQDIVGADHGIVETVAHAKSAMHVFPASRRDLRRRRHRREDHDPAPGHGGRLPAEFAVLVR